MTITEEPTPGFCTVAVVGGGTAGLAMAAELKRLGIDNVVVIEREKIAGGVARHCGHYPFGIREYGRLLKGPDYARRNVETANTLGVNIRTEATVTAIHPDGRLSLSTPSGLSELQAQRVALCTGVRESSRAQRLIGGDRPNGIVSTGALQSMVYLHQMRPFRRPVILGSELVSFSAIQTCRHVGIRPIAMIEENERAVARRIFSTYTKLIGVPLLVGAKELRIVGGDRVEAIRFTDRAGKQTSIETDGVIVSGQFRPESALLWQSHLEMDPGTRGPSIDQCGRCSDPAYYSAGNMLRPAETSAWCWREGVATARRIAMDLTGDAPQLDRSVRLLASDAAIRFVVPQRLVLSRLPHAMSHMQIGLNHPVNSRIRATSGEETLLSWNLNSRPVRRILAPLGSIIDFRPTDAIVLSIDRGP